MSRVCYIFKDKKPRMGKKITRRGISKKAGGIGLKITGKSTRRFLPNLQTVRAVVNGQVKRIRVSTKAIKAGLVQKAPRRKYVRPEQTTAS